MRPTDISVACMRAYAFPKEASLFNRCTHLPCKLNIEATPFQHKKTSQMDLAFSQTGGFRAINTKGPLTIMSAGTSAKRVCGFLTDVEGNYEYFQRYVAISKVLSWASDKQDKLELKDGAEVRFAQFLFVSLCSICFGGQMFRSAQFVLEAIRVSCD